MRIKIRDDAAQAYSDRNWFGKGSNRHRNPQFSPDWMRKLEAIQGQWIDVETNYLFKNQYNTVPIPGVSDNGLRIHDEDISEIDYENKTLQWIHEGMRSGAVDCHSVKVEHLSKAYPNMKDYEGPCHRVTFMDVILK